MDCILSADPDAFLLVAYGRLPMAKAFSYGAIEALGRRPEIGPMYQDLFFNP